MNRRRALIAGLGEWRERVKKERWKVVKKKDEKVQWRYRLQHMVQLLRDGVYR